MALDEFLVKNDPCRGTNLIINLFLIIKLFHVSFFAVGPVVFLNLPQSTYEFSFLKYLRLASSQSVCVSIKSISDSVVS